MTCGAAAVQELELLGDQLRWTRSGCSAQAADAPIVSLATDGVNFSTIGAMQWLDGSWQLRIASVPTEQNFDLRVSLAVGDGVSQGLLQTQARFFVAERLFADGFEN